MKVELIQNETTEFENVKVGDVIYFDGEYYLKISD